MANINVNKKYVAAGFILPPLVALLLYLFVSLLSFESGISKVWVNYLSGFPLYENLLRYSSHSFSFFFVYFFVVLTSPISLIYWWSVIPNIVNCRNKDSVFFIKLSGSCLFLLSIVIFSWFIDIDVMSDRRAGFVKYVLTNPVLYYLLFVFPVSMLSWFLAGASKIFYLCVLKQR